MVRGALAALLGMEADIEVAGVAADGEEAWRELQRLQPDLLVTDIEMPGLGGLDLAARIARHELPVKVVIVTTFARAGFLRRALDAGVRGYLLKDAPPERLAEALRTVHRGGRAIDPELALEAWTEADPLNERERQVLRLAGEGLSSAEIASRLGLSQGTVRNYLSEAIGKLGAANRIEAHRLARRTGGRYQRPLHSADRGTPRAVAPSRGSTPPPQRQQHQTYHPCGAGMAAFARRRVRHAHAGPRGRVERPSRRIRRGPAVTTLPPATSAGARRGRARSSASGPARRAACPCGHLPWPAATPSPPS